VECGGFELDQLRVTGRRSSERYLRDRRSDLESIARIEPLCCFVESNAIVIEKLCYVYGPFLGSSKVANELQSW
jgi:hypothetical protein